MASRSITGTESQIAEEVTNKLIKSATKYYLKKTSQEKQCVNLGFHFNNGTFPTPINKLSHNIQYSDGVPDVIKFEHERLQKEIFLKFKKELLLNDINLHQEQLNHFTVKLRELLDPDDRTIIIKEMYPHAAANENLMDLIHSDFNLKYGQFEIKQKHLEDKGSKNVETPALQQPIPFTEAPSVDVLNDTQMETEEDRDGSLTQPQTDPKMDYILTYMKNLGSNMDLLIKAHNDNLVKPSKPETHLNGQRTPEARGRERADTRGNYVSSNYKGRNPQPPELRRKLQSRSPSTQNRSNVIDETQRQSSSLTQHNQLIPVERGYAHAKAGSGNNRILVPNLPASDTKKKKRKN